MNSRLLELKSQAEIITVNGESRYALPDEFAERFAELIVEECAGLADEHNSEVEGVTLGVGKAIKQHFGEDQ